MASASISISISGSMRSSNLHHRRRRRVGAEGLGVGLTELLPAGDVGDIHAGAHHMLDAGDDLDTASSLRRPIPGGVYTTP
jgi:hypothetical protein